MQINVNIAKRFFNPQNLKPTRNKPSAPLAGYAILLTTNQAKEQVPITKPLIDNKKETLRKLCIPEPCFSGRFSILANRIKQAIIEKITQMKKEPTDRDKRVLAFSNSKNF